jgi:cellulose synthase/poly-beta-1,6-N-acetylglucosamine synthase-like glycosyltransferase
MKLTDFLAQWQNLVFLIFCIVVLVQVFYYLYFFSRLAYYKAKDQNISQTHPVSVIICARDEAENLVKNLPGALIQQYKTTHEVIVVNDNSLDESKYILEEYQKTYRQLHIIELKQEARFIPGKKFPLSVGIKTAKYEIVLLTDADCVPASEHWMKKMQQGYTDGIEIVLGYGPFRKKKGLFNKVVRWETFHVALQYLSYALAGKPYMGVGRNLSYKKELFFRHKGFSAHNHIPGGDDDLFINMAATKTNTAIVIDPDTFTLTEPPANWKKWIRQKRRHYTTGRFYKSPVKLLLGLYALSHFLFYPLLVISIIWYSWKISLIIYAVKLLIQGVILYKVTRKLDEKDLFRVYLFLDIWMFFYYLMFAMAPFRKPQSTWK